MLRLHYHEQMRLAAEEDRCDITVGLLRERLAHAGKPIAQLSARALGQAVRRLARHSIVRIARGFDTEDDAVIEVTPLVEKVLPDDRIQEIAQRIKAYVSARPPVAGPEAESEPDLDALADEPQRDAS
jgi:hypothetical protein